MCGGCQKQLAEGWAADKCCFGCRESVWWQRGRGVAPLCLGRRVIGVRGGRRLQGHSAEVIRCEGTDRATKERVWRGAVC